MTRRRWMAVAALAATFASGAVIADGLGARGAEAQAARFRECFAVRMYSLSTNEVLEGATPRTTRIPAGWTPLAGAQAGAEPALVLCR